MICIFSLDFFGQTIGTNNIFGRYRQFVWQDQHGLPQNGISTIVQTPDGYLWLAIAEGVVRFDGVKFTAFDTGNTPEIKSNNVQALTVARDGTLWIGTYGGGVTSLKNGVFRNFSLEQGLSDSHIKFLFEDSKNNLWIGTDGGGLNLYRDGKFTVFTKKDGLPDDNIRAVAEDADGNIWVGSGEGLTRIANGKFTIFKAADGLAGNNVVALLRDRENRLWIGGADGLSVLEDRKFRTFGEVDGIKQTEIQTIAQDRDGTLFFGTSENGLYRKNGEKFELVNTESGLVNNNIQSVFADKFGDLWLGTSGGGLAQLHLGKFKNYTISDGLKGEMVGAVFADSSGAVWVGTDEALSRFKDGKFTEIKMPDGTPIKNVSQITQDASGNFWLSANDREVGQIVFRFDEVSEKIEIIPNENFSRASVVLAERDGNIWFGTGYDGLHRIGADGSAKHFRKADWLADEYITNLFQDKNGAIWIGTLNGLSRLEGEKFTTFSAADGFSGKHILSFHEDSRGNLWIGTHGEGLFRFRDGKFSVVTSRDGLYDNLAFRILEDDRGNLWMSGNKGIYRTEISELEDFFDAKRKTVESFSYGATDGMISRECNGASPAGTKTADGKLWFPTVKGVVVVDPNQTDSQPPSVMLESVLIDDKTASFGDFVEMLPEQENLEIGFSAISWNRPQQVRFRYKLEGLDTDWTEAGTRRTAYFPHIAAGNYTFRVIADNGEGVWNETGKSLKI
ncbi:MAG TPA: two-component regulator propeller domain-containing protein, partial [Pyrinomonadaceae bacterium]|nr:two-component regulator propeller domain-containing protein [Pyrinomonadaceae bacterium]